MPVKPQTFAAIAPSGAEPFVPPRPALARSDMRFVEVLAAVRTNMLALWSREAYEADFLVGRFFARRSVLVNAPTAIHRGRRIPACRNGNRKIASRDRTPETAPGWRWPMWTGCAAWRAAGVDRGGEGLKWALKERISHADAKQGRDRAHVSARRCP